MDPPLIWIGQVKKTQEKVHIYRKPMIMTSISMPTAKSGIIDVERLIVKKNIDKT